MRALFPFGTIHRLNIALNCVHPHTCLGVPFLDTNLRKCLLSSRCWEHSRGFCIGQSIARLQADSQVIVHALSHCEILPLKMDKLFVQSDRISLTRLQLQIWWLDHFFQDLYLGVFLFNLACKLLLVLLDSLLIALLLHPLLVRELLVARDQHPDVRQMLH